MDGSTTVGREEQRLSSAGPQVWVYPNPADEVFNIETDQSVITEVHLVNLWGQIVTSLEPRRKHCELNVSSLPQGIYTLKLRVGDQFVNRKVEILR